jgi:hypothetical protein
MANLTLDVARERQSLELSRARAIMWWFSLVRSGLFNRMSPLEATDYFR